MIVVGLTGSIGMGKTTVAAMFRRQGVPVHDADAVARAKLVDPAVLAAVPEARDPEALRARAFADPGVIARLEAAIHPLVFADQTRFLKQAARRGAELVVLDVPLLFETGADRRCDLVAVVSAPASAQRRRVLARPGMTVEKLAGVLRRQMPDAEKRRRADRVIPTGRGRAATWRAVRDTIAAARACPKRRKGRDHA